MRIDDPHPATGPASSLAATLNATRGDAAATLARLAIAQERAAAVEPWLKAFYFRPADYSAQDPHALAPLPLAGLPIGVKDLIATADMPTTYGSPIYADFRPAADAWIVARIRAFGGVVFGKTVTTEFAWRHPGPTVNPWNRLHTPGGSSSGSAAAVAAGIVPLALGTQTVGSVLRPAAFCGVVGYKPSHGRVPTDGVHPLAPSLDHVGFFAKTVEDVALAYALFVDADARPEANALLGAAAWQAYFTAAQPLRLGVVRTPFWDKASAAQQANFAQALARLRAAGVTLVERDPFDDMPAILDALQTVLRAEAFAGIGPLAASHPDLLSDHMKALTAAGAAVPPQAYRAALDMQRRLRGAFPAFLDGCDALVTIPAAGEAPEGLSDTGDATFCAPWSFLGVPAVSVPSGRGAAGLPLGLQLVGDMGADLALLRIAAWVENVVR
ncbi:amidase [Robbsia sp. Bb-Pol-6]|uniref:Amidase n=1 Tax=Robbsia betulipollinis TaxID=2981849 RepID=A0ABT3ZTC8_9BURK|nr:amidase [Robbsia betulipollinis]MCY0389821.1 amidase [Robbsia betulipollinis]